MEDLREQESVSRILAELLENQEEFFDSDDDDISNTNDYSSINDQVNFLSYVLLLTLVNAHKIFWTTDAIYSKPRKVNDTDAPFNQPLISTRWYCKSLHASYNTRTLIMNELCLSALHMTEGFRCLRPVYFENNLHASKLLHVNFSNAIIVIGLKRCPIRDENKNANRCRSELNNKYIIDGSSEYTYYSMQYVYSGVTSLLKHY